MNTYTFSTGMTVTVDCNNDGMLIIKNDKTIGRYKEICEQMRNFKHPGFTFAFGNEQAKAAIERLKPLLKPGEKILVGDYGMLATPEAWEAYNNRIADGYKAISEECDPQEVYCYEYNNHECCISWDGDIEPLRLVRGYFGDNVEIHRFR